MGPLHTLCRPECEEDPSCTQLLLNLEIPRESQTFDITFWDPSGAGTSANAGWNYINYTCYYILLSSPVHFARWAHIHVCHFLSVRDKNRLDKYTVMSEMLPTLERLNMGNETTRSREVSTKTSTKTTPTDLIYNSDFNIHENISIQ